MIRINKSLDLITVSVHNLCYSYRYMCVFLLLTTSLRHDCKNVSESKLLNKLNFYYSMWSSIWGEQAVRDRRAPPPLENNKMSSYMSSLYNNYT